MIPHHSAVWDLSKGGKCIPQSLSVYLRTEVSNKDVVVKTCVLLGCSPGRGGPIHLKSHVNEERYDIVFCNSTFISLPMQRRLFIAVIAALAAWWCANSTKQYGSLPEKNISQNLLMTWFSLPGSRMILHPFTGPIWLNRAIISSSVTWSISYQVSILVKIKAYQVSILILIKAGFL